MYQHITQFSKESKIIADNAFFLPPIMVFATASSTLILILVSSGRFIHRDRKRFVVRSVN